MSKCRSCSCAKAIKEEAKTLKSETLVSMEATASLTLSVISDLAVPDPCVPHTEEDVVANYEESQVNEFTTEDYERSE